ncbi:hypothetical protein ACFQL9_13205 [Halobaculum lipolyticum]|uniref:Helix-turn-helix domain-containing protein n=1 Tax=Halobaculum lipolyticum TaxID=3032001 RepID=A0ABD5WDN0_9EURY
MVLIASPKSDPDEDPVEESSAAKLIDDPIEILHTVTQPTRFNLLQNIVGHPKGAASLPELSYMSKYTSDNSTLHEHLSKLQDVGIVEKIEKSGQAKGYPRVFYRVPNASLEFLQQRQLLTDVGALQMIYERREKPDEIKKAQSAPRPGAAHSVDVDEEAVVELLEEFIGGGDAEETVEKLRELQADADEDNEKAITKVLNRLKSH